jgi:hypothetical protein
MEKAVIRCSRSTAKQKHEASRSMEQNHGASRSTKEVEALSRSMEQIHGAEAWSN